MSDGFFAVCSDTWLRVCELGINPATAFLVLASGTGHDNKTTSWSVNAIETYTGISRPRAKAAIQSLIQSRHVQQVKHGTRPQYHIHLSDDPSLIWLPNALVVGLGGEVPPAELLRQSKNLDALRLLVSLYRSQSLLEDGGVEWRPNIGLHRKYDRTDVGRNGQYTVWEFDPVNTLISGYNNQQVFDHFGELNPQGSGANAKVRWEDYWSAIQLLQDLGLLQFVSHLVDDHSVDGEIIHPLPVRRGTGEPLEQTVTYQAQQAARALCDPSKIDQVHWAAPVPTHFQKVQLVDIARLKYRPLTKLTKAWLERGNQLQNWANRYAELAGEEIENAEESIAFATSR